METGYTGSWKAKETSDEQEKGKKWEDTERPTQQTREMITAAGLNACRQNVFNVTAEISSDGQDDEKLGNSIC